MDDDNESFSPSITPRQAGLEEASPSPLLSRDVPVWSQPALVSERISWAGDSFEDDEPLFTDDGEESLGHQDTPVATEDSSTNVPEAQHDTTPSHVVQFI